jgi:hypothetical protein
VSWRAYVLIGVGLLASLSLTGVEVMRLRADMADHVGEWLWPVSMLVLLVYSLFPQTLRTGWLPRWPVGEETQNHVGALSERQTRLIAVILLAAVLVVAAAMRLIALGDIPLGVYVDEGDRTVTSLDVLNGQGPRSWFDSGWFFINMVYFRLLALSMAMFGVDLAGGRMFSALCGIGFVAAIAWLGCRNFGWRIGLIATAFAAGMAMNIQHSRFISEAVPTALLWAISIGCFLEAGRTGRAWAWVLAGLTGGVGLYFYPSARLWAVGAALTVVVLWLYQRDRHVVLGASLAGIAALIASAPFLMHLSTHPEETMGRYQQTTVLDPNNQLRLGYLKPPEPLPRLLAIQTERTLGMFDRYPEGGGFLPTDTPLFAQPLAALMLTGLVYTAVRGFRDPRLAVLSIWAWIGLSGVAVTVETPDYLRAVGMLPSLCFIFAVPLVAITDRVLKALSITTASAAARPILAGAVPGALGVLLIVPQVTTYFGTFRSMPTGWAPYNREGQLVAQLGEIGPVYALEANEHELSSGWVRVLATRAQRSRVPNPGRELPIVAPLPGGWPARRPEFFPVDGQGLSVVLSADLNQRAYDDLLRRLYPEGAFGDGGDGRRVFRVAPAALADTSGVTLLAPDGSTARVAAFGEVPADAALPAELTWRAGVRFPPGRSFRVALATPHRAQLRLDGVPVLQSSEGGPLIGNVVVAPGVHFVELVGEVRDAGDRVSLRLAGPDTDPRELTPLETYRLMDAPWGLLARVRPQGSAVPSRSPETLLDATVAMAFFDPEMAFVIYPSTIEWSGTLLAPRDGTYRMAFAAEDLMHLQIDDQPIDVVTVKPDQWPSVGVGSLVRLTEGPHSVRVTLEVTHGGRELARWNWVPPAPNGAPEAPSSSEWAVVPPQVLRPDPGAIALTAPAR